MMPVLFSSSYRDIGYNFFVVRVSLILMGGNTYWTIGRSGRLISQEYLSCPAEKFGNRLTPV